MGLNPGAVNIKMAKSKNPTLVKPSISLSTTFCLSCESFHSFQYLTNESPKMTVTLLYFFTCFCGGGLLNLFTFFLHQNYFFYHSWFLFGSAGFVGFTLSPILVLFSVSSSFDSSWYPLDVDMYVLFGKWVLEVLTYLFGTLKSLLVGAGGVCCVFLFSSNVCMMQLLVLFGSIAYSTIWYYIWW